jgi:hypothetical protein
MSSPALFDHQSVSTGRLAANRTRSGPFSEPLQLLPYFIDFHWIATAQSSDAEQLRRNRS